MSLSCIYYALYLLSVQFSLPGMFGHPSSPSLSLFLFSVDITKKNYYFYLALPGLSRSMWYLVPQPGIKPGPPALGAQSLSHWLTGEVPSVDIYHLLHGNAKTCFFQTWLKRLSARTQTHTQWSTVSGLGFFVCCFSIVYSPQNKAWHVLGIQQTQCETCLVFLPSLEFAGQEALVVKNLPANAGDGKSWEFNPWVRKIPWRRGA